MKHIVDDGVVAGTGDKYQTRNPLSKYLIRQFDENIAALVRKVAPKTVLEIGCGEGHTTQLILEHSDAEVVSTDISEKIIRIAEEHIANQRVQFDVLNIYDAARQFDQQFDLIVCCEVFEHLDEPEMALVQLAKLNSANLIISVPNEPLWRVLNMLRGAYLSDLGNTPGHLQHWGTRAFKRFVEQQFAIVSCHTPIPWNLIHSMPKPPG